VVIERLSYPERTLSLAYILEECVIVWTSVCLECWHSAQGYARHQDWVLVNGRTVVTSRDP
jgi:hypothetical protein